MPGISEQVSTYSLCSITILKTLQLQRHGSVRVGRLLFVKVTGKGNGTALSPKHRSHSL